MSQNNTNRDIRRFETDADGNTTRVLLNTDEPLGLLDGDYQEQLAELENRLNAITGGAYSNTVQISHGGTGAESAGVAMSNLITALDYISQSDDNSYAFVAQRVGGTGSGNIYTLAQGAVAEQIGALKASNNLSDLSNTLTGLQNLYHDVTEAQTEGGQPITAYLDGIYAMLGKKVVTSGENYYVEPKYYTLKNLVDNYLSEYLLKASNNLSDLSDLSTALGNLLNDVNTFEPVPGPPIDTQLYNLELYLGYISGPPSSPFTIPKKITVEYLYENYILPVLNTEYGMTENSLTNLYEFTGNAATATASDKTQSIYTGNPTSLLGQRFFDVKTVSSTATGQTTVTATLTTTSSATVYNILSVTPINVDTGKSVTVKGFTINCENVVATGENVYTITVDVEAIGTGVSFDIEILYCYKYVG